LFCLSLVLAVFMGEAGGSTASHKRSRIRRACGAPLIVYFDRNDPSQSITNIGFKSRHGWVGLLVLWTFAALISAVTAQACDNRRAIL
jgi:hypothetical protein